MATDLTPAVNTYYIIYTNESKNAVRSAIGTEGGKAATVSATSSLIDTYTDYVSFSRQWVDILGEEALYGDPFVAPTLNSDNPNYYSPRPVSPPP